MQPAKVNLTAWQNSDFNLSIPFVDQNGNPHDFAGSSFAMDIKLDVAGAPALAVTIDESELAEGIVGLSFSAGDIAAGEYVYDLVRITGPARELMMYGAFTVLQGVTQP